MKTQEAEPVVSTRTQTDIRAALAVKRLIDLIGSGIGLLLCLPLFVVIAAVIKLDSSGPVFYRRRLVGFKGKSFVVIKFRTMVENAHDLLEKSQELGEEYKRTLKIQNDPRVTTVGRLLRKSSLDELPQLISVFRGEMSLVGPRMLGDLELARYGDISEKLLSVKPGITGWWQVNGRQSVSFERRLELDLQYVERWSLWFDLKILLMTIPAVLSGEGAL